MDELRWGRGSQWDVAFGLDGLERLRTGTLTLRIGTCSIDTATKKNSHKYKSYSKSLVLQYYKNSNFAAKILVLSSEIQMKQKCLNNASQHFATLKYLNFSAKKNC